jgi:hypothetical protein
MGNYLMIENPILQQTGNDDDEIYLTNQYYEHCADVAHSIAKEFNLLPGFYDEFTEYYTDLCLDSDDGYSIVNQKSLIDDWWEENKHIYDDPSPYEDYEPTDIDLLNHC